MTSRLGRGAVRLRAFAKINLGLRVLGLRADGYHELRTVYQTITLHDRLEVRLEPKPKDHVNVFCSHPEVPAGEGNLVHRACHMWREARQFRGHIAVLLEKRIPMGSGLGGGSSDAATTLLGLEALTGNLMSPTDLLPLAARLGSDVPLFLLGGRVFGIGRGEEVYPLSDLPSRDCLVVFPGLHMSTVEAYQLLDSARQSTLTKRSKHRSISVFGAWPHLPLEAWGPAENDFESVVFARWPELARLKRTLIRAGAESASLTGSGSAIYALFPSSRALLHALPLIPTGWQHFKTRSLGRRAFKRRLIF
jgi:4-diphosphocytidyl-2-C-methyl-D-erythritol kinase